MVSDSCDDGNPTTTVATGPKRLLLLGAGFASLGFAYLGAILPGLPTTPWVLLASYCFGRSSPRMARWIRRSPFFGTLIRDWETHRGVRRPVKVLAVCAVVVVVTLSVVLTSLPDWLKATIAGLAGVGVLTIVFVVPTAKPTST